MREKHSFVYSATKTAVMTAISSTARSTAAILAGGVAILIAVVVMIAAVITIMTDVSTQDCDTPGGGGLTTVNVGNVSLSPEGLTVKGAQMDSGETQAELEPSERQSGIAAAIAGIVAGREKDFPGVQQRRITETALSTAIVESELSSLDYGDRDSLGAFQQRPSMGWGSEEQVQNIVYATNKFLDVLLDVEGWESMPRGSLAQAVQRSGFPDRYDDYMHEAEAIYKQLRFGGEPAVQTVSQSIEPASCGGDKTDDAIDTALEAIEASIGSTMPGAEAVVKAYAEANVELPADIEELVEYRGDDAAGVSLQWIEGSGVAPGSLERGDILVYSDSTSTDESDASFAGLYQSAPSNGLKIATYNVLGSNHTPKAGPRSGVNRVATTARVIESNGFAVVGLQEFQEDQRARLMQLLPSNYDIFPKSANYGRGARPPAVISKISVVYDTNKVRFVDGSNLRQPLYMAKQRRDIPLVKFEFLATGQEFNFINVHEPAHYWHKGNRLINARERATQIDRLGGTGIPLFYVGDMNSQRKADPHGVITRSGVIQDAFDGWKRAGNPARRTQWGIDRIYGSVGTPVVDVGFIDRNQTGSDHPVIYATYGGPFATSSSAGSLGTMVAPNAQGIVNELPVTKRGLVGVLRPTITEPESEGGVTVAPGEWTLPIKKGTYTLTGRFGQSGSNWSSTHSGLDFAAPSGTPILAVANGKITETGWAGAYGNRTVQELADGTEIYYAHQTSFNVTKDQTVSAGEVIGYVGSTGNSTGPHLHLEVRPNGGGPVDPAAVLTRQGVAP